MGILQDRARVEEGQSIIAAWQDSGLIEQVFPLHETSALTQLQTNWVRKMFAPQPLGKLILTHLYGPSHELRTREQQEKIHIR